MPNLNPPDVAGPAIAGGAPVSTAPPDTSGSVGGGGDRAAFAHDVLVGIGITSPSQTQIDMMLAWMQAEHAVADTSSQAAFNPLNTTLAQGASSDFNSFGPNGSYHVRNYPTWQAGVAATVATISQGNFGGIAQALRNQDGNAFVSAIGSSGWGTNADTVRQYLSSGPSGGSLNGPVGMAGTAGTMPTATASPTGAGPAIPNAPAFDPAHPVANDPTLDQSIAVNYPEYAWAFNDPELGPILRYAAKYNENGAWVQAQVQATNWWRKNSDSMRQWQLLQQTDPAQALQQMHNQGAQITQQAKVIGLNIAPDRANQLAQEAQQFNWTPEQVQQALYAEYQRVSQPAGQAMGVTVGATGTADTFALQATQMAHEYLSTLTPQQAQQIGFQIATGQMDQSALSSMFVGQAKARFKDNPDLMQALDAGITPAQVLGPYQQTLANLLEVSPDQINFSDPRYAAILSTTDARGTNRLMTQTEAANWARSQPEWTKTENAKAAAASTTEQVLSTLGAAKYS